MNYIHQHQWDAHQQSIEQCKSLGNQQAAYFIQRDLTFRKDVRKTGCAVRARIRFSHSTNLFYV